MMRCLLAERTTTSSSSSSGNGTPNGSIITDSDISFLGKLLVFSFAGGFLQLRSVITSPTSQQHVKQCSMK
jgi:hypothetical protein